MLSFLVNDQLRVFTVFLIGADQQKIHICGNAEAAVAAKLTFQLVAEVGRLIVKEFDGFSVGKAVCKVDILAYKRVELFHLGHPVNMQIVEFIHQRLLILRKGFRAAKVYQDKIRAASDKIELVLDTVVTGLMGEDSLQGLHLKNVKTGEETQLPVDGMFVFVGYEPQNSFLPVGLELDPQGFIITDCEMRTNLPGLFAAGDIRSKMCRQVTTAVGDGATAATAAFTYLEQLDA